MSALDLRFHCDDLGEDVSIRGYLRELLMRLWEEGESFSGKRPFGNSGWEHCLYKPLIAAGLVQGELDEDGYIDSVDEGAAYALVCQLIDEMCAGPNA